MGTLFNIIFLVVLAVTHNLVKDADIEEWLKLVLLLIACGVVIIIEVIVTYKVFRFKIKKYIGVNPAISLYYDESERLYIALNDEKQEIFCVSQEKQYVIPICNIERAEGLILHKKGLRRLFSWKRTEVVLRVYLRDSESSFCDFCLNADPIKRLDELAYYASELEDKFNDIIISQDCVTN